MTDVETEIDYLGTAMYLVGEPDGRSSAFSCTVAGWQAMGSLAVGIEDASNLTILNALRKVTAAYSLILQLEGHSAQEITQALHKEWRHAKAKHGDRTLDKNTHSDYSRFYALAEECGEVAACTTYDNDKSTGHNSDLFNEAIQVIGLALAWKVAIINRDDVAWA